MKSIVFDMATPDGWIPTNGYVVSKHFVTHKNEDGLWNLTHSVRGMSIPQSNRKTRGECCNLALVLTSIIDWSKIIRVSDSPTDVSGITHDMRKIFRTVLKELDK